MAANRIAREALTSLHFLLSDNETVEGLTTSFDVFYHNYEGYDDMVSLYALSEELFSKLIDREIAECVQGLIKPLFTPCIGCELEDPLMGIFCNYYDVLVACKDLKRHQIKHMLSQHIAQCDYDHFFSYDLSDISTRKLHPKIYYNDMLLAKQTFNDFKLAIIDNQVTCNHLMRSDYY